MTIHAAVLDAMLAAGATAEVIAAAVRADNELAEAQIAHKRSVNAERQRRFRAERLSRDVTVTERDRNAMSRDVTPVTRDILPPDKERSPRPPKEINPPPINSLRELKSSSRHEDTVEFLEFWTAYPHKIGKGDARKTWPRALEKAGSLAVILDGLQRYKRTKPPAPDGPPWCNPSTWLNQERWADEPRYAGKTTEGEVLYKFSTVEEVMARRAANGR